MATAAIEALGSGLGYRPQFRAELFAHRSDVDFLEIIADHYFDAAPERRAELDLLRAHFPLVAHGLDLSIGSAQGIDAAYLEKLARLIERIDPPWWSEHLCFTRAGGIDIGHLAALPFTQEAVAVVARNVARVRDRISAPLILENITTGVRVPGAEMDEPEFLTRVLDRTGCGWLCDVANLYTNAVNHGVDLDATFERWPWDRLVQVHYAGGRWRKGVLIDSHDVATSEAVWALYARIVARTPVKGGILERDERLPAFGSLLAEVKRAREIMRQGDATRRAPHPVVPRLGDEGSDTPDTAPPLACTATPDRSEGVGLQKVQAFLARLFTDAELRRDFVGAPTETAVRAGLDHSDAATLALLDTREVEDFACGLFGKRALDARKALPLTAKALGKDFDARLFETMGRSLGSQPRGGDGAALSKRLDDGQTERWIADLARYEATFVAAARSGPFIALRRFRFPVDDIARRLRMGEEIRKEMKPLGRVGLWLRAPGGKLRFWMF